MILSPHNIATTAAGARNVPKGRANCMSFFRTMMKKTPTRTPANEAGMSVKMEGDLVKRGVRKKSPFNSSFPMSRSLGSGQSKFFQSILGIFSRGNVLIFSRNGAFCSIRPAALWGRIGGKSTHLRWLARRIFRPHRLNT